MNTADLPKVKAYSYVRFSTPEQARGDSLRRQMEKAERYALEHGLDLVNDDRFRDLGVSAYRGKNKEQGGLADFLQAVRDGVVEQGSYLLVESMDRISREKPRRAARLLEDICDSGINVVTVGDGKVYTTEALDNDPMTFMYAFMVAIRANEESEVKGRRVREAWGKKKARAAAEGKPMTKRLPAWLSLAADRATFHVIPDRVDIVRRIFREAEKGTGQHAIAQRLNEDGVPTFGDGKRQAEFWHRSYIAKILGNPAVIGTMTPHEAREIKGKRERTALAPIPDYYPAIIQPALFKRLQSRASAANAPRMRGEAGEISNVLAGLAKCPACGSTMTRINKGRSGGTPYLICTRAKAGAECDYRQVKLEQVEGAVTHAATRDLVHAVPTGKGGLDEKRKELLGADHHLGEAIEHIMVEIERGNPSPALRTRLAKLEGEHSTVREELDAVEEKIRLSGGRALARVVKGLEEIAGDPKASKASVNAALRDAFTHVVVDYTSGDLRFHWKHGGIPTPVPYTLVE